MLEMRAMPRRVESAAMRRYECLQMFCRQGRKVVQQDSGRIMVVKRLPRALRGEVAIAAHSRQSSVRERQA